MMYTFKPSHHVHSSSSSSSGRRMISPINRCWLLFLTVICFDLIVPSFARKDDLDAVLIAEEQPSFIAENVQPETVHFVTGCPRNDDVPTNECLAKEQTSGIAVQCCSGTLGSDLICKRKGCRVVDNYADAEAFCVSTGSRLCTVPEVNSNVCCGKGCWFNKRLTWTSSVCSENSPTNIISTAFTAYEQLPHDTNSFTQGLSYGDDGFIYETTGIRGESKLLKIDPNTFEVIKSVNIDKKYFGEGSTYYTDADGNGRLIYITWQEQTAFIYDPITLTKLQTLSYNTAPPWNEGWGITFDSVEGEFIVSDGTSTLFFMDRDTLAVKRSIVATRFDGTEQDNLNELELMGGLICCNIWFVDEIICVDKITGRSVREYDLSTLYPKKERGNVSNVLNGIALGEDHVLITGKWWDRMYKVRFDDWGLFT